jgi:hypothetical protein
MNANEKTIDMEGMKVRLSTSWGLDFHPIWKQKGGQSALAIQPPTQSQFGKSVDQGE